MVNIRFNTHSSSMNDPKDHCEKFRQWFSNNEGQIKLAFAIDKMYHETRSPVKFFEHIRSGLVLPTVCLEKKDKGFILSRRGCVAQFPELDKCKLMDGEKKLAKFNKDNETSVFQIPEDGQLQIEDKDGNVLKLIEIVYKEINNVVERD